MRDPTLSPEAVAYLALVKACGIRVVPSDSATAEGEILVEPMSDRDNSVRLKFGGNRLTQRQVITLVRTKCPLGVQALVWVRLSDFGDLLSEQAALIAFNNPGLLDFMEAQ